MRVRQRVREREWESERANSEGRFNEGTLGCSGSVVVGVGSGVRCQGTVEEEGCNY